MNTDLKIYSDLLRNIKICVRTSQIKATISLNTKMLEMYFDIGEMIDKQQKKYAWGTKIIKKLAIDIKNENCINCMYCVFGCPGNNIEIDNKFKLSALCSDFKSDYENRLKQEALDKLFNGFFIKLPKIRLAQFKVKYKSFSDFTSVDETKNISVWGANSLKFLSKSSNNIGY